MKKVVRLIIYKILYPIFKFYWFIFRPETFGVKCVIEYNGKILMIRNNYGKKRWTFPGGGIKKGESPERAAQREIKEELNIDITEIRKIGQFISTAEYKKDNIYCFYGKSRTANFMIDEKEILDAQWLLPENLPRPMSPVAEKIFNLWYANPR